jgi:hypothetical protein
MHFLQLEFSRISSHRNRRGGRGGGAEFRKAKIVNRRMTRKAKGTLDGMREDETKGTRRRRRPNVGSVLK